MNRHELVQHCRHADGDIGFVFFWGHHASPKGVTKSCFSQWYAAQFVIDGVTYKTAEHFMMAEKARLFGDDRALRRIIDSDGPKEAKAHGRAVQGFEEKVWRKHRTDIVVNGNLAKFQQNGELRDFLVGTGAAVLVEASRGDQVWGIGLAQQEADAKNPQRWKGENLLGFCLMRVRDILVHGEQDGAEQQSQPGSLRDSLNLSRDSLESL